MHLLAHRLVVANCWALAWRWAAACAFIRASAWRSAVHCAFIRSVAMRFFLSITACSHSALPRPCISGASHSLTRASYCFSGPAR